MGSDSSEVSAGDGVTEFAAIGAIARRFGPPPAGQVWIGDDAAALGSVSGLLLAADLVVAGVHADLRLVSLADLGYKALAVNVSDIAAMGGWPLHAVVSVAGPPDIDLDQIYDGLVEASVEYSCPVVGGDLSDAGVLVVSVALTGTTRDKAPVLRSGASAGDVIFVTGPLGASAAGLEYLRQGLPAGSEPTGHDPDSAGGSLLGGPGDSPLGPGDSPLGPALAAAHRRPRARLAEGQAASLAGATAMIDISDGLGADIDHLAAASGVGLALDRLPVAAGATEDQALGGGEDYELVFAAPDPEAVMRAFGAAGLRAPIALGRCTVDRLERRLGSERMAISGWQHRRT